MRLTMSIVTEDFHLFCYNSATHPLKRNRAGSPSSEPAPSINRTLIPGFLENYFLVVKNYSYVMIIHI
jgi:hypothetical protein